MPRINGKRFNYNAKGKAKAAAYRKRLSKKKRSHVITEDAKPTSKYKHPKGARYK
jgi:hypothetical protein